MPAGALVIGDGVSGKFVREDMRITAGDIEALLYGLIGNLDFPQRIYRRAVVAQDLVPGFSPYLLRQRGLSPPGRQCRSRALWFQANPDRWV